MKRIRFWAYNNGSGSVNKLLEKVNGLMLKHEKSKFVYTPGDIVINWGFSRPLLCPMLNRPERVSVATSKCRTFDKLKGVVPIPEYTTDLAVASGWRKDGHRVLGRDADHGSQGRGITVYDDKNPNLGKHLFYVKYVPKKREFRIHVWLGKVIFVQEKLRVAGARALPEYNAYVRSHEKAWVFAFKHLDQEPVPEVVKSIAIDSVAGLGLDFGACDIGYNEKHGAILYEINTAPGIEETTLEAYVGAINAS